jgi:hypothetical protein
MREKVNVLVHGAPKSGKTTMAVRRNPGVLIADTEGSSKLIKGVKREAITSMADMDRILTRIKSGEVTVVVIDTLDELVNAYGKDEVRRKGGGYIAKDNLLSMQGWGFLRDRFLNMTRAYRDAGADVLTLCHSELVEVPEGGKKWTLKLPSDYAREVAAHMDVIGFLQVEKAPDGSNVRRLHLEKSPMYDAGVRSVYDASEDKFYNILPPVMENAAFVDILSAYDKFFAGEGAGFIVIPNCENCAKTGAVKESAGEVDGHRYCVDCLARHPKLTNSKA